MTSKATADAVQPTTDKVGAVRVRFPIAMKLIAVTGALIMVLSAGFVIEGLLSTQRQYKQAADSRRDAEIASLTARGLATTRNLADGMYGALLDGDIARIADMVQSVARGDEELLDAVVVRTDGRIVARAKEGVLGEQLPPDRLAALTGLQGGRQLTAVSGAELPPMIAFGSPIEVSTGGNKRREGYLSLEMSTVRIARALKEIESERSRAVRNALIQTVGLGIGALLVGIFLAVLQGLSFGRAIGHLTHVASEVGRGNLQARATLKTADEIGVLCERFNDMTSRVQTLLKESVEKAAMDQELERANAIQGLLMPPRTEFKAQGLTYCGLCETASKMGGDWWHHYQLSPSKTLLCIGDVTGHGIPSAMLTGSAKACCDTVLFSNPEIELVKFMKALDHVIHEAGKGELVMTFFAAILDTQKMTIEFANAGHNFPMVWSGGKMRSLLARGGRLGDGTDFTSITQPLVRGDLLLFYTDGLVECTNPQLDEYGVRRFRRLVDKHQGETPMVLRQTITDDAEDFFAGQPHIDDVTLVVCRVEKGAAVA